MKRVLTFLIICVYLQVSVLPVLGYYQRSLEVLCDSGLKFYRQGRYEEAVSEFQKALLINPDYTLASRYIQKIEGMMQAEQYQPPTHEETVKKVLDNFDKKKLPETEAFTAEDSLTPQQIPVVPIGESVGQSAPVFQGKRVLFPQFIYLDETFSGLRMPIELSKGASIVVRGNNILRFLVSDPKILGAYKQNNDELLVTANDIGYSYLIIWDAGGRWTVQFLGIQPLPEGPTYEEELRQQQEASSTFKIRYSLDWSGIDIGRGFHDLKRSGSYSYIHNLSLTGQTPYGDLDSAVTYRRLATTELTFATLGLTNGHFGNFNDFYFRGGDYTPYFSNLAFPGASLRGTIFTSPAFEKKLEYSLFWGRESGGRNNLAPDLFKSQNSFLDGFNLSLSPDKRQNYQFTLVHGWGRDRENFLNGYNYDLLTNWDLGDWKLGYDVGYDTKTTAHLFNTDLIKGNFELGTQFRDINTDYVSSTGTGWNQGQLGELITLDWRMNDNLRMTNRLDIYRDRLFPALDDDNRWNEDFDWRLDYSLDPQTDLELSYFLQNDLGKISQFRYFSPAFGISHRIKLIRDIYTFLKYSYSQNTNFSAPSVSYYNNRVNLGFRLSLTDQMYYYVSEELNWLREIYNNNSTMPQAFETGIDWTKEFSLLPIYTNLRFTYRNEEDASSPLSFLAGQDYIEGYAEVSYRASNDQEIYGNCRIRNSWADNENVSKRLEASFNTGLRCFWDTGISWNAECDIEVLVFKDLNSDGLRQKDEPPLAGVKAWLGKDKFQITDLFGMCKFKGVRGRRVSVSVDMSTVPSGYLMTVPATQEAEIFQDRTVRLYFGMNARSEISGVIFVDTNNNGKFDGPEKGLEDILVSLEDGSESRTDRSGKYYFPNALPGKHTLNIALNTIPINYLPKSALTKEINLFEGMTYIYNVPLREVGSK